MKSMVLTGIREMEMKEVPSPMVVQDPYQFSNLVEQEGDETLKAELKVKLTDALLLANDEFLPEQDYLERFGLYIFPEGYPPMNLEFDPNL